MQEIIKTVMFNYAFCALAGGALEYIIPQKNKQVFRIAVVAVLLLVIFLPVTKTEISSDALFDTEEVSEEVEYNALLHTANLTERKLREEMKEILINNGVNEYEIYISTSVDEEKNTVYLDEIKIEVGKEFADKIPLIKNSVSGEYKEVLKVGVKNE